MGLRPPVEPPLPCAAKGTTEISRTWLAGFVGASESVLPLRCVVFRRESGCLDLVRKVGGGNL